MGKTGLVYHPAYLEHDMGMGHPESPNRLRAIVQQLEQSGTMAQLTRIAPRMAESLGVDVARLFTLTFALGSGLAALGGGIGAEILGLDPQYPLRYLAYVLIVVAVGGLGRVSGVFLAALIIGVLDFVLKVQFPKGGTMFIYALAIILLLLRPQGLTGRRA